MELQLAHSSSSRTTSRLAAQHQNQHDQHPLHVILHLRLHLRQDWSMRCCWAVHRQPHHCRHSHHHHNEHDVIEYRPLMPPLRAAQEAQSLVLIASEQQPAVRWQGDYHCRQKQQLQLNCSQLETGRRHTRALLQREQSFVSHW